MENGQRKRRKLSSSPSEVGNIASSDSFREFSDQSEDVGSEIVKPKANGVTSNHREKEFDTSAEKHDSSSLVSNQGNSTSSLNGAMQLKTAKSRGNVLPADRSIFDFQVENLLRQLRPVPEKVSKDAENLLRKIKGVIESMSQREPLSVDRAEKALHNSNKVVVPFPQPRPKPDVQYKLSFQKPTHINVVGSYALKTASSLDQSLDIDLFVQMPSSLFTEKDYLNYRYFHKRAYYLACIAAELGSNTEIDANLNYSLLNGNPLLPILVVKLNGTKVHQDENSSWKIHILPGIDGTAFEKKKTLPHKNCVRPSFSEGEAQPDALPPTPLYNGSLRVDCSVMTYLKLSANAASRCSGYRNACRLGRTWLRQRGFASSIHGGGFGHFEWAILMAMLLQAGGPQGRPLLSPSYSGQQLFKATIQFLAMKNLTKQPFVFEGETHLVGPRTETPLILEGRSGSNLLFKMTPWSYVLLQKEAQATIKVLNSNTASKFESLFVLKVHEPLEQYDLIVKLSNFAGSAKSDLSLLEKSHDFQKLLITGLNDRVDQVNLILPTVGLWPTNTMRSFKSSMEPVMAGIILNPVNASRAVERGPAPEDSQATTDFRSFWGEKSELRRFKDGQILESIVWTQKNAVDITKEIISYLTSRHFGKDTELKYYCIDSHTIEAVRLEHRDSTMVSKAFLGLENHIRSLQGLPLQIRQIQRVNPSSESTQAMEVVIQFEGSVRWPDSLQAIQMTKIAFLLKLQELIEIQGKYEMVRVGLENQHSKILNQAFLDLTHPENIVFRIRIYHDREQTLLKNQLGDKTILPSERSETAEAMAYHNRNFIRKPLHTQAVIKTQTRFSCFDETRLLVKAWFEAHLLGNHFHSEFVDVITARTFLDPFPWTVPSSVQTGFLRTLSFISKWDWQSDPLIVDFSSSMKPNDYQAIETRFKAWRQVDPDMNRLALFVATDFDPNGDTWTEHMPSKVAAARLISLSQAACKKIKDKGIELSLGSLFQTSLKEYDFVLRISKPFNSSGSSRAGRQSHFKNLQSHLSEQPPDATFDLVTAFLQELESVYGDSVLFFYGKGSDVIAGLWSPHTARRAWKIGLSYSTLPLQNSEKDLAEGAEAVINKEAMLAEMARLGDDMIEGVDIH